VQWLRERAEFLGQAQILQSDKIPGARVRDPQQLRQAGRYLFKAETLKTQGATPSNPVLQPPLAPLLSRPCRMAKIQILNPNDQPTGKWRLINELRLPCRGSSKASPSA